MPPVEDHGLEVLKKSGEEVIPGSKADYLIKTQTQPGSTSIITNIQIGDSSNLDAFDRLRVSNPNIEFEILHTFGPKDFLFTTDTATGGTIAHNALERTVDLSVNTTSGSRAIRQSKRYVQYTPGISMKIVATMAFNATKTGLRQRVGFFDANDGWFWELDDNIFYVVQRSNVTGSPVDTRIAQTSWNIDVMDGTGISGKTLELTKQQVLGFDFQFLGSGRSRFFTEINGIIQQVHEFNHANITVDMYNAQPAKPIRYEIENTTNTASNSTLSWHCSSVISEGSKKAPVISRPVINLTSISITTAFTPLISIRLKSDFNRATILPKSVEILTASNKDIIWKLTLNNTTLTAPTWVSVAPDSITEFDILGTATPTGQDIIGGFSAKNTVSGPISAKNLVQISSDFAGVSDILTLSARTMATTGSAHGNINFEEIF